MNLLNVVPESNQREDSAVELFLVPILVPTGKGKRYPRLIMPEVKYSIRFDREDLWQTQ